jgi:uncharacterized protein YdeI (YjbR/CyaY-like superfamily)
LNAQRGTLRRKAHVEQARESGAMTPAGEAKIAIALANGQWSFIDEVDRLEVPADLAEALAQGGAAEWGACPPSVKRGTLEWIKTAKTAPTRAARIAGVAQAATTGLRPPPF